MPDLLDSGLLASNICWEQVNEQIGSGEWSSGEELGKTWENRNSFSYGRKGQGQTGLRGEPERGVQRTELLQSLLNSTDRVIQEIDCVEYGLTDIQEYYANTGAIKKAAENNRGGRKVSVSGSVDPLHSQFVLQWIQC